MHWNQFLKKMVLADLRKKEADSRRLISFSENLPFFCENPREQILKKTSLTHIRISKLLLLHG